MFREVYRNIREFAYEKPAASQAHTRQVYKNGGAMGFEIVLGEGQDTWYLASEPWGRSRRVGLGPRGALEEPQ